MVKQSSFIRKYNLAPKKMFDLLTPPSWAPTWCYVYLAGSLLGATLAVVVLFTSYKKLGGFGAIALLFMAAVQFVHGMTYFWICRSALA
jgi:hypothetical protein